VEINALWYNALRETAAWARAAGDRFDAGGLAERVRASFMPTFWNPAKGCLRDLAADDRIRPNQVIALALPHRLVPDDAARSARDVVEGELLTPYGLRTLARGEPGYVPHYGGGPAERDGAYHQGTVWPWLLAPYARALRQVRGAVPRDLLAGLE